MQDSAFGLFARNLEARTDNGELLNLIDGNGCPLNELIFPALQLEGDSRALNADFKVSGDDVEEGRGGDGGRELCCDDVPSFVDGYCNWQSL